MYKPARRYSHHTRKDRAEEQSNQQAHTEADSDVPHKGCHNQAADAPAKNREIEQLFLAQYATLERLRAQQTSNSHAGPESSRGWRCQGKRNESALAHCCHNPTTEAHLRSNIQAHL